MALCALKTQRTKRAEELVLFCWHFMRIKIGFYLSNIIWGEGEKEKKAVSVGMLKKKSILLLLKSEERVIPCDGSAARIRDCSRIGIGICNINELDDNKKDRDETEGDEWGGMKEVAEKKRRGLALVVYEQMQTRTQIKSQHLEDSVKIELSLTHTHTHLLLQPLIKSFLQAIWLRRYG